MLSKFCFVLSVKVLHSVFIVRYNFTNLFSHLRIHVWQKTFELPFIQNRLLA